MAIGQNGQHGTNVANLAIQVYNIDHAHVPILHQPGMEKLALGSHRKKEIATQMSVQVRI